MGEYIQYILGICVYAYFLSTLSQFLMPGLVDCNVNAPQYIDAGLEVTSGLEYNLNTLIPTEVAFQNSTFGREVSKTLVVSRFFSVHLSTSLPHNFFCILRVITSVAVPDRNPI